MEFLFILVGLVVGFMVGVIVAEEIAKKQAIEAGVAEWSINPKTGEKTFIYKKLDF